jgi:hypothetical protein
MDEKERAVIEAARQLWSRTIDTETGEVWLNGAVCTWNTYALVDAVRRLDGYPPYGTRKEPVR